MPKRRFDAGVPEMMDAAGSDFAMLREDLRNLRTINRYFGGLSLVRRYVTKFMAESDASQTIEILDLATGSADHPLALASLARSVGRSVHITAVERNPATAAIARDRTKGYGEISIQEGDLLMTPWPPKKYDLVLCSLALHHFSREDAVRILGIMWNTARVGVIVNELNRSWPAAWVAWGYTHLTTRNPMTLNDSYVSVLRAFTPAELAKMAVEAGIPNAQIHTHPFFRLALVAEL